MIRRINITGGPGSGKSTLCSRLFADLNLRKTASNRPRYNIEQVHEYVKDWAFEGRKPVSWDQLHIFAQQMKREDVRLRSVRQVITDSPILLSAAYAKMYGFGAWTEIAKLADLFEKSFPSIYIILDRDGVPYEPVGRYQSHADAVEIDRLISDMVYQHAQPSRIHTLRTTDYDAILSLVEKTLQADEAGAARSA